MASKNAQVVETWFEQVWNQGNEAAIDQYFAATGISRGLRGGGDVVRGPVEFKSFWRDLKTAFPDINIKISDVVEFQDNIAVTWIAEMTHQGNFGPLAPTQRRVKTRGIAVNRIENGKIVDSWNVWDQDGLMSQLV
jgi:predicted ester cyclase